MNFVDPLGLWATEERIGSVAVAVGAGLGLFGAAFTAPLTLGGSLVVGGAALGFMGTSMLADACFK